MSVIPILYLLGCGQTEIKQDAKEPDATQISNTEAASVPEVSTKTETNKDTTKSDTTKSESSPESGLEDIKSLISINKSGKHPSINVPKAKQIAGTSCMYSIDMKKNKGYSLYRMKRFQSPNASPLYISYKGEWLQPVSTIDINKAQEENTCNGTFAFPTTEFLISVPDKKINVSDISVALNPDFPLTQFDTDFWWLFTKNSLRIIIEKSPLLADKKVQLDVQLRKMGGSDTEPRLIINKEFFDFSFREEDNLFVYKDTFSTDEATSVIHVKIPSGCSDMLIEKLSLVIDNQEVSLLDKTLVKTSEEEEEEE